MEIVRETKILFLGTTLKLILKWLNLLAAWCKWHLGCCPLFTVLLYCQKNLRKVSDPFDIVWWMTPHFTQRLIEDEFNNLFLLIPLECFLKSSKIRSLLFDISRRCQIFLEGRFDREIKFSRLLRVKINISSIDSVTQVKYGIWRLQLQNNTFGRLEVFYRLSFFSKIQCANFEVNYAIKIFSYFIGYNAYDYILQKDQTDVDIRFRCQTS